MQNVTKARIVVSTVGDFEARFQDLVKGTYINLIRLETTFFGFVRQKTRQIAFISPTGDSSYDLRAALELAKVFAETYDATVESFENFEDF
jgi:hypothetical protein